MSIAVLTRLLLGDGSHHVHYDLCSNVLLLYADHGIQCAKRVRKSRNFLYSSTFSFVEVIIGYPSVPLGFAKEVPAVDKVIVLSIYNSSMSSSYFLVSEPVWTLEVLSFCLSLCSEDAALGGNPLYAIIS